MGASYRPSTMLARQVVPACAALSINGVSSQVTAPVLIMRVVAFKHLVNCRMAAWPSALMVICSFWHLVAARHWLLSL